MKLFVDVDDTLVLYDMEAPNPYGVYEGTPYTVNERLIEGLRKFRKEHPQDSIFIWSGGGAQYAEMWAAKLNLEGVVDWWLTKDKTIIDLIEPGDIVIDDMDVKWRTHTPFNWPEE